MTSAHPRPSIDLFQLYLLSGMSARGLVREALKTFDAGESDVRHAKQVVKEAGIDEAACGITRYISLLGPPIDDEVTPSSDASHYDRKRLHFALPLWKDFHFVISVSDDGIYGNAEFRRASSLSNDGIDPLADLRPWHVVSDDLRAPDVTLRTVDEWYPTKQVEYGRGKQGFSLRFDYGLLQLIEKR